MDVRKILWKINLILDIENAHNLQTHFDNLLSYYTSNEAELLENEKESIVQIIEKTEISNFAGSDLRILDGIGIRGYFDMEAIENLEKMLNLPGFEASQRLNDFVNERAASVNKISGLKEALEQIGVEEEQTGEIYQLVLSIPGKYQDLNQLGNLLKDIKNILHELNSKVPDSKEPRIISVNNGSIEFFIAVGDLLASYLTYVFDHSLQIYATIMTCKELKNGFEHFDSKRKKAMDKNVEDQLEEDKEKLLSELLENLPSKTEEDKTRLKKLIFSFTKHLENGVQAEIKTPEMVEPEDVSNEDDEETRKRKKEELERFEQKKIIDDLNKRLLLAQKKGFKLGLLHPPEEDENTE